MQDRRRDALQAWADYIKPATKPQAAPRPKKASLKLVFAA
jgi:hypothetical protein